MAKRLVIFVEGEGDAAAIPPLAQRVLTEIAAHDALFVDREPYRAKSVATLVKDNCRKWHNWLQTAGRKPNLGAVLLVLDGDLDRVPPLGQRTLIDLARAIFVRQTLPRCWGRKLAPCAPAKSIPSHRSSR